MSSLDASRPARPSDQSSPEPPLAAPSVTDEAAMDAFARLEERPTILTTRVWRLPAPNVFNGVGFGDIGIVVHKPSLGTTISFQHHGVHRFNVSPDDFGWAAPKLWRLFHRVGRNPDLFGRAPEHGTDDKCMTTEQRINVMLKVSLDILHLLALIIRRHKGGCTGYAVAYLHDVSSQDIDIWWSYDHYLNYILCKQMIASQFLDDPREYAMIRLSDSD